MNDTVTPAYTEETDRIRATQAVLRQNRSGGLEALNNLFRSGTVPDPTLEGPYEGELVAVDRIPGLRKIAILTTFWMPWKGKQMDPATCTGDNIMKRSSRWLFYLLYPFYKGIIDENGPTFRAFVFNTSIGPGLQDPDVQVFKLDYDSAVNPAFTIRPILDEVVQIHPGVYLGKIHFKSLTGKWKMLGYFSLRSPS